MAYLAFMDESGNPSLNSIDPDNPMFTLVCCLIEQNYYYNTVNPEFDKIKYEFWGHRNIIFRSYDIRKQKSDFKILTDKGRRITFYERLNGVMSSLNYTIISCTINKQKLVDRYIHPYDPYKLTMEFIFERASFYLRDRQDLCHVIIEARTKNQNQEVKARYNDLKKCGNQYHTAEDFSLFESLRFISKSYNETGLQIADLAAYPLTRYALGKDKEYEPTHIVLSKVHRGKRGGTSNMGLRYFRSRVYKTLF